MTEESARARGHRMVREAGYRDGGGIADEKQDKTMVTRAVHEHEAHDHKGEAPTKLKLRRGGQVHGKDVEGRPDRRARGGAAGKSKVGSVKIVIGKDGAGGGPGGDPMHDQEVARAGMQQGMRAGAEMGARAVLQRGGGGPPRPPMAGPPGGPPPGGPPGAGGPPMMPQGVKDGGKVKVRGHERRRAGGAV